MIRRIALAAVAALSLLALPVAARAADNDPGFAFYEKQAKEVLKTAGNKVWEAADDAERQGFHQFAIEQAQRALEFDPDQPDSREYLKYEKKQGKWVQDEAAFKAMPQGNVRPSNRSGAQEPEEVTQKRQEKWRDESLKKADKFVAARYAELGDICAAKGFKDQAQKGYEAAMRLDKDNEKARKGLGYIKFGKTWLTKKQDDARKSASKADAVKEPSDSVFETLFSTKLNKVESLHIRIESSAPVDELQAHCVAAETAYAYYLADFGIDPTIDVFDRNKITFVIMTSEDQWNKFVDQFAGQDKEFSRQCGSLSSGIYMDGIRGGSPNKDKGNGNIETSANNSPEGRRDTIVHRTTHTLNAVVWKISERAWLDEGLAYYYTAKVLDTTGTYCVGLKHGDYANQFKEEGGMKKWDQSDNWKPLVKATVQKKNDVALRLIMNQKMYEMQFDASVKAWSVCSWLMELDREKFMTFLKSAGEPGAKQDIQLQNTFDKGIEELEKTWQAWVLRCY